MVKALCRTVHEDRLHSHDATFSSTLPLNSAPRAAWVSFLKYWLGVVIHFRSILNGTLIPHLPQLPSDWPPQTLVRISGSGSDPVYLPEVQSPFARLPHVACNIHAQYQYVEAHQVRLLTPVVLDSPILGLHVIYTAVIPLLHFSFECDAQRLWSRLGALLSDIPEHGDSFWFRMGVHETPHGERVPEILRAHTTLRAVHCLARVLGRRVLVYETSAVKSSSLSAPARPWCAAGPTSDTFWPPVCVAHDTATGWTPMELASATKPIWCDPAHLVHTPTAVWGGQNGARVNFAPLQVIFQSFDFEAFSSKSLSLSLSLTHTHTQS